MEIGITSLLFLLKKVRAHLLNVMYNTSINSMFTEIFQQYNLEWGYMGHNPYRESRGGGTEIVPQGLCHRGGTY